MAKEVRIFIAELLQAYQEITDKTYTEMALDFDVTLSNLYKYRNGKGNPTAKTIDKIVKAVEKNCPELLEKENWSGDYEQGKTSGSLRFALPAWCNRKLHRLFPHGLRSVAVCGTARPAAAGDEVAVPGGGEAV